MTAHDHNQPDGDLGYLLTAYADGQLAPEGVAWVEAQLAQRPELRERLDEIRGLQAQLRAQLQHLPMPIELDATRRERLLAAAGGPRPALRMPSQRWRLAAVAALLVCTVGGVFMSVSGPSASAGQRFGYIGATGLPKLAKAKEGDDAYANGAVNSPASPDHFAAPAAPAAPLSAPAPVLAFKEERQKNAGEPGEAGQDKDLGFGRGVVVAGKTASAAAPTAQRNLTPVDYLARGRDDGRLADGKADASGEDRRARSIGSPGSMPDAPKPVAAAAVPAAPPAERPTPVIVAKGESRSKAGGPGAESSLARKQVDEAGLARPLPAKPGAEPPTTAAPAPFPSQQAQAVIVAGGRALHGAATESSEVQSGLVASTPASDSAAAFQGLGAGGGQAPAEGVTGPGNKKSASLRDRSANEAKEDSGEVAKTRLDLQNGEVRAENRVASVEPQSGNVPLKTTVAAQEREQLAAAPDGAVGGELKEVDAKRSVAVDAEKAAANGAGKPAGQASVALAATHPDPRVAAAALVQPVALRADGQAAALLNQAAAGGVGLAASPAAEPGLAGTVRLTAVNLPRGQALIQLARGAGLQARLVGGTLQLDATRAPLDPTDLQGLDREAFRQAFATQPMTATAEDARSTFALDADTASYEVARAQLRAGQTVDPAAIQPEHFINAMPMDYPPAQGPEAFTLYAEAAPSPFAAVVPVAWSATNADRATDAVARPASPWAARTALVAVGAVARPAGADERRPLHLTLAIDCSGSMAQPGGLERIQVGLLTLISHLRAEDRVGIVAFGDQARVVLPATPGSERERLAAAVRSLSASGSTNCAEGLALAYQLAAETVQPGSESRVVLATDGGTLAGAGAPAVVERVAGYRQRGITLLILGCGSTAYQSQALEELANKGDGQHLFLGSDEEARGVFSSRLLPERLSVLAKDAKVQVTWNAQRVSHFRLIGYEKRRLAHQDFRNDAVDAGEISHDTQVTALYEVLLVDGASGPLGSAAVRYFDTRLQQVRELTCPLPGSVLAPQPSQRLRLLACAAELAEFLQRGWWSNVHASSAARILAELKRCDLPAARELEELTRRAAAIGTAR